jgi:hypothetical protein
MLRKDRTGQGTSNIRLIADQFRLQSELNQATHSFGPARQVIRLHPDPIAEFVAVPEAFRRKRPDCTVYFSGSKKPDYSIQSDRRIASRQL